LTFLLDSYAPMAGMRKSVVWSLTGDTCGGIKKSYRYIILPKRRYFKTEQIVSGNNDTSGMWKEICRRLSLRQCRWRSVLSNWFRVGRTMVNSH